MERTIEAHTTRKKDQKGFAAGFWKGKAYLIDEPNLRIAGHHAMLFFVYMRMLLHLEQTFTMPDVVRLICQSFICYSLAVQSTDAGM